MSDYRDPNDPMRRDSPYTASERGYGATWGWVAGAVFLVIMLAIALGVRNEPTHTASNDTAAHTTPAPTGGMKPTGPANPTMMPRPAPAPAPTPNQ